MEPRRRSPLPFAVRVHPQFLNLFFVLTAFVAFQDPTLDAVGRFAAGFLITAAGLLLHELGHAFAARRFGIQVDEVVIHPLGGMAKLLWRADQPALEWRVAAAGPAVNLLLAGAAYAAASATTAGSTSGWFLGTILGVNLVIGAGNLLPAFPLDGGRILRALLTPRLGRAAATRLAVRSGRFLALGLLLVAAASAEATSLSGPTRIALALLAAIILGLGELERLKANAEEHMSQAGGAFRGAFGGSFGDAAGQDAADGRRPVGGAGPVGAGDFVETTGASRVLDDDAKDRGAS